MKKTLSLLVLIVLLCVCGRGLKAQENVVKYMPSSIFVITNPEWGANYAFGFAFERAFGDKFTAQANFDIALLRNTFGSGFFLVTAVQNLYIIEPEAKYYLLGESLDGFYAGGQFGVGFGNNLGGAWLGPGGQVGYQLLLINDRLALDFDVELGPSIFVGNGNSVTGFHMQIGFTGGYAF